MCNSLLKTYRVGIGQDLRVRRGAPSSDWATENNEDSGIWDGFLFYPRPTAGVF